VSSTHNAGQWARHARLLTVAALICFGASCRETAPAESVIIPKATHVSERDARSLGGLPYRPVDEAIAWLANESIIVAHIESYAAFDMVGRSCAGTGIYQLPVSGAGTARAIRVGKPICDAENMSQVDVDRSSQLAVYSINTRQNSERLVRLDLISGRLDSLAPACTIEIRSPAISPDGKAIAFSGICARETEPQWGAYVIDLTNGAMRKVYGGDSVSAESPVWSPDGASLALALSREPSDSARDLVVVSIASGKRTLIAKNGIEPAWEPGGSFIAYLNDDRDAAREIHLSKSDGSSDTTIYKNAATTHFSTGWGDVLEGNPSSRLVWSPDGRFLLFSRYFECGASIWRLDIHSGVTTRITAPAPGGKRC
jgi:TolB protein